MYTVSQAAMGEGVAVMMLAPTVMGDTCVSFSKKGEDLVTFYT